MATALQSFRFTARSCRCPRLAYRYTIEPIVRRRAFSTTPFHWQDEGEERPPGLSDAEEKANRHSGAGYRRSLEAQIQAFPQELQESLDSIAESIERDSTAPDLPEETKRGKTKKTFLNMGESEVVEEEEDDDGGADISSIAHGELEAHREKRHYARLAAWEMPLLAKMAKSFVPPTADMPLRFRYTTYLGEQHPAEKKVVLEFCPADMPDLTELQREKLKKLVGVRYNPETDIIKMSSEMFESQAQNKRYLGDRVDELLKEARDSTDTFEDVPLDLRHHVVKPKPKFPDAWRMTAKRQAELAQYRAETTARDQQRMIEGQMIDGVKQIEEALARVPKIVKEAMPIMVMASKGAKGKKQRTVAIRR